MTNDTNGNSVNVTLRHPHGSLTQFAKYPTGGLGTGGGLGSQGALAASRDGRMLLATNPGSDEVTLFRVYGGVFLIRASTVASGGTRPTSVAIHKKTVYVLNAGSDSVSGFRIRGHRLQPIPGASYPLSQSGAGAAQVGFSSDGRHLIVTERATNRIGVFRVRKKGLLSDARFFPSAANTPFGFLFRKNTLVVSEAVGGAIGASAVSTYKISKGKLKVITGAMPTKQSAACWIAIPRGGKFAYTTNTGSGTVTGFGLSKSGALSSFNDGGRTGNLGAAARPIDFAFGRRGNFLFVLDAGGDRIDTFYRTKNGGLVRLTGSSIAVPDGTAGLLAR